jgi:isopenicillin N synthase-like dioxygenase
LITAEIALPKQLSIPEYPMSISNLPTIDISPFLLFSSSLESKQAVATALNNACRDHGFFYLTGHNIPQSTFDAVLSTARSFFSSPQSKKDEFSIDLTGDGARGYQKIGQNVTQYKNDWHEGLDLYAPLTDKSRKWFGAKGRTLTGENKWPSDEFRSIIEKYIEQLKVVGAATMQAMALALNVSPDTFTPMIDESFWYVFPSLTHQGLESHRIPST